MSKICCHRAAATMAAPAVPIRRAGGVPVVRRTKPASTSSGSQMGPLDRFVTAAANFLPIIVLVVLVGSLVLVKEIVGPTVSLANEAARSRLQFSDASIIEAVPVVTSEGSPTDCETPISMGDTVTFHLVAKSASANTPAETIATTYGVDAEPFTRKLLTIAGDSRTGDFSPAYLHMLRGACPGARLSALFPVEARLAAAPAASAAPTTAGAPAPTAVSVDIEVLNVTPRTPADDEDQAQAEWAAASPMGRVIIGLRRVNPFVLVAIFVAIRAFRSFRSARSGSRTVSIWGRALSRVTGALKGNGNKAGN